MNPTEKAWTQKLQKNNHIYNLRKSMGTYRKQRNAALNNAKGISLGYREERERQEERR